MLFVQHFVVKFICNPSISSNNYDNMYLAIKNNSQERANICIAIMVLIIILIKLLFTELTTS